ncbi:MAG: DJ-1/PfpI family protein [Polyangiales bacterium]
MRMMSFWLAASLAWALTQPGPASAAGDDPHADHPHTGPEITNHDQLMGLKPEPNVNANGIGIFVYDGVNAMDALGPFQVFSSAGLNVFLVAKQKGTIRANNGLRIAVDKSTDEVTRLDVLVVPGGASETAAEARNPETLQWVKKIDAQTIFTTSVCTGAWVLGEAGLLQDRNASANWYRAKSILARYGARYTGERWTRDGKYWTSAGVTAGMDMALALVNQLFGHDYTQAVMLDLEYDPQPPIAGGSVAKTKPAVAGIMEEMYDMIMGWFANDAAPPARTALSR